MSNNNKDKLSAAADKKAEFGEDIDIASYQHKVPQKAEITNLDELNDAQKANMRKTGINIDENERSGTFVQFDHSVICHRAKDPNVEVMNITEALEKHEWLRKEYYGKAVKADTDKYTAEAEINRTHGYFIRAKAGAKITYPLQSCLFMEFDNAIQNVHNIIIVEEGAELHVITGCSTSKSLTRGLHIGVSEFFIKKHAKLMFTMIHNWNEGVAVRPRTVCIVEEHGIYTSNYISLEPVKTLQTYPTVYLKGEKASAYLNNIVIGHPDSELDIGGRVVLQAPETSAEIISRTISAGGKIIARGHLKGEAPKIKAHLECDGLILSDKGTILAVPELEACLPNIEMSHEASIGKIAPEEITYLMARGLTEQEAISLIIRGFIQLDIPGLGPELEAELEKLYKQTKDIMGF